jgi:uncharacterized membrane protein
MWLFAAMLGGVAAALVHMSLWPIGAAVGGLLGWWLSSNLGGGEAGAEPAKAVPARTNEERLRAVERELAELRSRLARLESPGWKSTGAALPAPPVVTAAPPPVASQGARESAAPVPARRESPPPARAAQPPPRPAAPPFRIEETALWRWLVGRNALARVGIVILFFGVSFLLRLAYAHLEIPIEARLAAVASGGAALFGLGWRLRGRRRGFALSLQGGGVGILYLTVFATFRVFELVPALTALALMVGLAAASLALGVAQESQPFGALGAAGGFLAPILAATGDGDHIFLFEYYAVLNAYVLGMAWLRSWRLLTGLGFAFTFVVAGAWGFWSYRPEDFASTEPFLIVFFLTYVAVPLLFARRAVRRGEGWVALGLVFAAPVVAFGLQVALVRHLEYGSAWSALALGGFYAALALACWPAREPALRTLAQSYLALATLFASLAIPLAFDAQWTSAAWALEGAAIVWAGTRERRFLARAFGLLLQAGAGVALIGALTDPPPGLTEGGRVLGCAFVALPGLFSSWLLGRSRTALMPFEEGAPTALLVWGLAWWHLGGYEAVHLWLPEETRVQGGVWFATATCLALSALHRRIDWREVWIPALGLLAELAVLGAALVVRGERALDDFGWVAWLGAFAAQLELLRRHEARAAGAAEWLHMGWIWLLAALASRELALELHRVAATGSVWPWLGWVIPPCLLLGGLAALAPGVPWPFARHIRVYLGPCAAPLALFVCLWANGINLVSDGDPRPFAYVPLLNPLDLVQAAGIGALALWGLRARRLGVPELRDLAPLWAVVGASAFACANGALVRAVHWLAGVPFEPEALFRSDVVQTSLSLFWTLCALGAMVVAARQALRPVWLAGATLIGVVVVKLFLVDLSHVGTLERIVSFIGVGLLLLVVGWVSPVPPRAGAKAVR